MKPGIAFCVGEQDEELRQSPIWGVFEEIAKRSPDQQDIVKARIERAMTMLFEHIFERLRRNCDLRKVYVTTITLSLPCRWFTEDYADFYRKTLCAGFGLNKLDKVPATPGKLACPPPEVHFLTESESYFHYIFSDEIAQKTTIRDRMMSRRYRMFVLLDMGGFSAVSFLLCTFSLLFPPSSSLILMCPGFDAEHLRICCREEA